MRKLLMLLGIIFLVSMMLSVPVYAAFDIYSADGFMPKDVAELTGVHANFPGTEAGVIGWATNGDSALIKGVNFGTNDKLLNVTVEYSRNTVEEEAKIEFHLDKLDGPLLASVNVIATGGWGTYVPYSADSVVAPTGTHDLYMVIVCESGNYEGFAGNIKTVWFAKTTKTAANAGTQAPSQTSASTKAATATPAASSTASSTASAKASSTAVATSTVSAVKTTTPPSQAAATISGSDSPVNGDDNNNNSTWLIVGIIVVVLAGSTAAYFVLKNKAKK